MNEETLRGQIAASAVLLPVEEGGGGVEQNWMAALVSVALLDRNAVAQYLFPQTLSLDFYLASEMWGLIEDYVGLEVRLEFVRRAVEQDRALRQRLLGMVHVSKETHADLAEDRKRVQGAANAMTLLNLGGMNFSDLDLSGIRIPGANLSRALLDQTRLQKADLTGVNLRDAWLRQTDLSGAKLERVCFGIKRELHMLEDVPGSCMSCAYSSDGRWLAVGCSRGRVRVWEAATLRLDRTFEDKARGYIMAVSFEGTDNVCLAAVRGLSEDETKEFHVWNVDCGRLVGTFRHDSEWAGVVAFGPDGMVAVGSSGIFVWDMKDGKLLHILNRPADRKENGSSVAFLGAGGGGHSRGSGRRHHLLASGHADHRVCVWDLGSGALIADLKGHHLRVVAVAFGRAEERNEVLASGSYECSVRLWSVKEGRELHTFLGHTGVINSLAFNRDSVLLASASADHSVRVWNVQTRKCMHILEGYAVVNGVAFDASAGAAGHLASADESGAIRLWDMSSRQVVQIPPLQASLICNRVAFSQQQRRMVGAYDSGRLYVWDLKAERVVHTFRAPSRDILSCFALGPDPLLASCGHEDKSLNVWDVTTGQLLRSTRCAESMCSVAFGGSRKRVRLATGGESGSVSLWDAETLTLLQVVAIGHSSAVRCGLVFDAAGSLLASGSQYTIVLWRATDDGKLRLARTILTAGRANIGLNPAGTLLACAMPDNTVQVFDLQDSRPARVLFGLKDWIECLALSPAEQGDLLATGHRGSVCLWDVHQDTCLAELKGFANLVVGVCWYEGDDGLVLATAIKDRVFRCWQVSWHDNDDGKKRLRVALRSSSYQAALCVSEADVRGATGLIQGDCEVLRLNGAIGVADSFGDNWSTKKVTK